MLKNRALVWMKVHAWMVTTFGRGWPLSAGELLCYLDERHEIQPMGSVHPRLARPCGERWSGTDWSEDQRGQALDRVGERVDLGVQKVSAAFYRGGPPVLRAGCL